MFNKQSERIESVESLVEFHQTISVMRRSLTEAIESNPVESLGYDCIIDATIELKNARIFLEQTEKSCREGARRRLIQEESIETSTLPQRLLKSPLATLAEARSKPHGVRLILKLWQSLARHLRTEKGWNDEELQLVRSLVGQSSDQLRLSRDAIKFSEALDADRELPERVRQTECMRAFVRHSESFLARLRELAPLEPTIHAAVLRITAERSFKKPSVDTDLICDGTITSDAPESDYKEKDRWPALRRFVARQIQSYRKDLQRMLMQNQTSGADHVGLHYTTAEFKRIESARKAVASAMSCYQKSIAAAKSIGLREMNKPSKKQTADLNNCNDPNIFDNLENSPKMKTTKSRLKSKSTGKNAIDSNKTFASIEQTDDRIVKADQNLRSSKCNLQQSDTEPAQSAHPLMAADPVPAWLVEHPGPVPNVRNRRDRHSDLSPKPIRRRADKKNQKSAELPNRNADMPTNEPGQNPITYECQTSCNGPDKPGPNSSESPATQPENPKYPVDPICRLEEELKKRQTEARSPGRRKRQGPQRPPENPSS